RSDRRSGAREAPPPLPREGRSRESFLDRPPAVPRRQLERGLPRAHRADRPVGHAVAPAAPVEGVVVLALAPLFFFLGFLLGRIGARLSVARGVLGVDRAALGVAARLLVGVVLLGELRLGLGHPLAVVLHVPAGAVALLLGEPLAVVRDVAERLARRRIVG